MHACAFCVTGCEYSMCCFVDVCVPFTHVPFATLGILQDLQSPRALGLIQSNVNRIKKDKHPWWKNVFSLSSISPLLFPQKHTAVEKYKKKGNGLPGLLFWNNLMHK